MKQAYLAVLLLLSFCISLRAQTCGNVTLTTQKEVDLFKCTEINGSLTINDAGSLDPITDLEPLFQNGLNGSTITGNVIIQNCAAIESLNGLRGIVTIGGGFGFRNNKNLAVLGETEFALKSIGGEFRIEDSEALKSLEPLVNLVAIESFTLDGPTQLEDLSVFDNLEECGGVQIINTQFGKFASFNQIKTISAIVFDNNTKLESITGFNSVESIKSGMAFGKPLNLMEIINNPSLSSLSGLESLSSTTSTEIIIQGNSSLGDCCSLTSSLASSSGVVTISGNGSGCSSISQIDAPPTLGTCPSAINVGTNNGSCEGTFTISHPSASDNCDFSNLRINIGGGVVNTVVSGNSSSYTLGEGTYSVLFTARDQNNNTTTCNSSVTIVDDEKPVISGIPANVTINCDDNFPSVPTPTFSDNCDTDLELTASSSLSMGNCELGEAAEIQSFTWTAKDDVGNEATANWEVTVISDFSFDLGAPISVCGQNSVTINPGNIGDSYLWSTGASTQSISVNSGGTYAVTVTTSNGCCYADDVMVTFETPPSASAVGGELSCDATSIQIMGSSTSSGVTYSWTGPGGFTSSMQNPSVMEVGTYTLTVSKGAGCSSTATAVVTADTNVPNASATGGTITCEDASVQLMGSSTSSGVTYSWTGPGGFTSSMQNPTVSTAGEYVLTVSSGNGCSAMSIAQVVDDSDGPDINIQNGSINCDDPEISYTATGDVMWTGPGGFSSSANTVTLIDAGTYTLTVTAANGCTASDNFVISEDFNTPNVSATGGALGCTVSQVTISGSSSTAGSTLQWTGPGGFTSTSASPSVSSPGSYTLTVTGSNGCTSSQTVEVTSGDDAPFLSSSGGIVDCNETSLELTVSADQAGVTFSWEGPGGFSATGSSVSVSEPGTYIISGTNGDGCVGTTSVEVLDNADVPVVDIIAEELNCANETVTFATTTFSDIVSYSWTGPDGFTSTEKEPEVSAAGVYTLVATGSNGCETTETYEVTVDSDVPDASAEGGTLTCTNNSTSISGNSTSTNISYLWEGPDGFTSSDQNPTVSVIGTYYLNVIGANGCVGIDSAIVMGDSDLPTISATGGTLDCNNETVTLIGSTTSEDVEIKWVGPNGFETTNPTAEVDIPGFYTFTVSRSGNCEVFSTVEVVLDNQDPDLLLSEGAINCQAGTRVFNVSTNALDGDFQWTGPNGFTSNVPNPNYSDGGTYELVLTASNGCSSIGAIQIQHDVDYEAILNITGNDVEVDIIGGTPPFNIIFNNSINNSSVNDLSNGDHFVRITDGLGCEELINFNINTSSTYEVVNSNKVSLTPNPVGDYLTIDWTEVTDEFNHVYIVSASGRIVSQAKIEGSKMYSQAMSDFVPGIYYVRIQGKKSYAVKRFVKM